MTAAEFWSEKTTETVRRAIVKRSGEDDTEWEGNFVDMPFWVLPNKLKATIYDSPEFRRSY